MRNSRMSSKRVARTFDVLWPSTMASSAAPMAIGQNRRPRRARKGPAADRRYRNTMQHQDPFGAREGEAGVASGGLKSRLTAAENVLATLSVDLDEELRFNSGLLALTDQRLLAPAGLQLQLADHAGVGTLDLCGPEGRLARWRYPLAQQTAALRLQKL